MWWLSGIFREVTLLARPAGAVEDCFVHADYDHETGAGTPAGRRRRPARVSVPELGVDAAAGETVELPAVEPWSAESPRLYDGQLATDGERSPLRIGFRTVAIADGVLTVNGRRVLFRGVNRHEFHPDRGRAVTEETMLRRRAADEAAQHQRRPDQPLPAPPPVPGAVRRATGSGWSTSATLRPTASSQVGWRGNPADDPRWRDALVDRMRRMVERDKNHPA